MTEQRLDFLANRLRHPPSNAVTFLENQVQIPGEAQQPVFVERLNRVDSIEVSEQQQKISDDLWKQADEAKATLFDLVEQVTKKLDKKGSSTTPSAAKVDLKQCTWDQVMQEVQVTASRWSATPNRETKRRHLDTIGRNGDAFNAWLQLLPGGDYGSSICGVFALAIGAASQYSKVEDAIVEALAQIPEIIEGARQYVSFYAKSRDHRLEEKTFDLYLAVLKALSHIMRFFADSSIRRFCGPLFMQSSYQKELLESIDKVKSRAVRVKDEAERCLQMRVMDMDKSLHIQGNILLDTYEASSQTLQNTSKAIQMMQAWYEQFVSHGGGVVEPPQAQRLPIQQQQQQQRKQVEDLFNALQFNPGPVKKDVDKCLRLGAALEETAQAKTASLIRNKMFKAFMTEHDFSAPLLVNGNDDMSSAEGQSPLSLVAARLAQLAAQTESSFGVSFFCAEHPVYRRNPSAIPPPVEMLCSLIGQLTCQIRDKLENIDLSFLDNHQWKKVQALNPKTLSSIFEELTQRVPKGSLIVCVIDEAWLYEKGPSKQITVDIFRRLTRLVRKSKEVMFKLFVTCRGRSLMIQEHFAGHILNLDESVEAEDSSAWTIANM